MIEPLLPDDLVGLALEPLWKKLAPRLRPALLLSSPALSAATGAHVQIVSETFQHTGSFKFRAALSVALHSQAPRLLCASSGNFGAALALAAKICGKGCTVVMPRQSAAVKIAAVRDNGATVDLIDTQTTTRAARVAELSAADPLSQVVSPYDDPYVIAGNSSLGAEIFAGAVPDCVIAPIGGGGLAAGLVLARDLLAPGCEVIGAEPLLANDAARSQRAGALVQDDREAETLCDGARTLSLGRRNFQILRRGLSPIIEVEERTIKDAVRLLYATANLKAEPTGALSLAGLLQDRARFAGRTVACIVSGGNVDAPLYAQILSQSA